MKAAIHQPREYLHQYLLSRDRYTARYPHLLFPHRVTRDPVYPTSVAIVELPVAVDLRGPRIYWETARLSHRLPIHRPDVLGFVAVLSLGDSLSHLQVSLAFAGEEVFTIYQKWVAFIDRQGHTLFHPPVPSPGTYEARVVHVPQGLLFADHANLRQIFQGVTVG